MRLVDTIRRDVARYFPLAAMALAALAWPPLPAHAELPLTGLVLGEFMAGPSTDWNGSGSFSSRDDEWVEVYNAGPLTLDLSSFLITDGDSVPRFRLSGTLEAGARLIVFGSDSYDWERANGQPAFGLSLANSGDAVMLWRISGPDTVRVDAYTYRSHEAAANRAVGRVGDAGPWALFDGLNPYTGTIAPFGTGCTPTPDFANGCAATATRRATWGKIKAIYR